MHHCFAIEQVSLEPAFTAAFPESSLGSRCWGNRVEWLFVPTEHPSWPISKASRHVWSASAFRSAVTAPTPLLLPGALPWTS